MTLSVFTYSAPTVLKWDQDLPISIFHLFFEFLDVFAVVLERVADGVLEVVDGHEVGEEGQNVLDLYQVVALLINKIFKAD